MGPSSRVHRGDSVLTLDTLETLYFEKLARQYTRDEVKNIMLSKECLEQVIKIGRGLLRETQETLVTLLLEFKEVFAWTANDVPWIPRDLMVHQLNVDPRIKLVQQKKRHFDPELNQAIFGEVDKLLTAKMIREVQYSTWLANSVIVKKS